MVCNYWMPVLISIFFVVINSVNGRPAESNIDNDLGDKNGVQMFNWNDYHSTRTEAPTHYTNQYSKSSLASKIPIISVPMLTESGSSSLKRDVQLASSMIPQATFNDRKLSQVIATSKNETSIDVECKSESKPIFFKPILNRLRSQKLRETEPETRTRPRDEIECHSESKVLNLRTKDLPPNQPESLGNKQRQFTKRDNLNDKQTSNSYHPTSVPQETPIGQHFRDVVKQYYSQNNVIPFYVFPPNTLSLRDPYISPLGGYIQVDPRMPTSNFQNAYLFIKANSFEEAKIKNQSDQPGLTQLNQISDKLIDDKTVDINEQIQTLPRMDSPVTSKIILRPLAKAKAGNNGVAISSPVSTAYVKRGDYVEIEYLPEAIADVGEGGVAVSKPELVIHFIDRRRK